ncbi:MAG: hypothetical protein WC807_18490 [Hyphomicrobium sp.]|jgi:hypothetical protein
MGALTPDEARNIMQLANAPQLTVSGLIEALEEIEREHGGDLPVFMHDDAEVREVWAYDAEGNTRGPRVEVMIHGVR